MIVEIRGLEIFGRHGVGEDERREGQTFLVDISVHVDEPGEDSIEATFDYRRARDVVRAISERTTYRLLETFAAAVADELVSDESVERARVRVRKPGVAWADWTAATVERP